MPVIEHVKEYTRYQLFRREAASFNNLVENAIRPFVLGRKNWLFSGHPRGAAASAAIFSLIETAKANGLEPYRYLRHLFEQLPLISAPEEYKKLLPQYLDPAALNAPA